MEGIIFKHELEAHLHTENICNDLNQLVKDDPLEAYHIAQARREGVDIDRFSEDKVELIDHAFAATNNGQQLGLGPHAETAWAHIYNDRQHTEDRKDLNNLFVRRSQLLSTLYEKRNSQASDNGEFDQLQYEFELVKTAIEQQKHKRFCAVLGAVAWSNMTNHQRQQVVKESIPVYETVS